jgi:hypothetical protein
MIYETDQELVTRFRYLTGKRPLGGFYAMLPRDFDWDGGTLRSYFEHHEWLSGWSLGEAESVCTAWARYRDGAGYTALPSQPAPMWWEGDLDPNMQIIEDRTKRKKCDRLYRPRYWQGVFDDGVKPPEPQLEPEPEKPVNDGLTTWQRETLEAFWRDKKGRDERERAEWQERFKKSILEREQWEKRRYQEIEDEEMRPLVKSISACPKCNEEMEWKPDMQWRSKASSGSHWNEGGVFYCTPCDAFFVPMAD